MGLVRPRTIDASTCWILGRPQRVVATSAWLNSDVTALFRLLPFIVIVPGARYLLSSRVRVAVYDVLGREVAVPVEASLSAGRYEAVWQAGDAPTGVYVMRLEASATVVTRRVVFMK